MDEAARALAATLVVIGAATVGVLLGVVWLYLRGELRITLTRDETCDGDCSACTGVEDTDWWKRS